MWGGELQLTERRDTTLTRVRVLHRNIGQCGTSWWSGVTAAVAVVGVVDCTVYCQVGAMVEWVIATVVIAIRWWGMLIARRLVRRMVAFGAVLGAVTLPGHLLVGHVVGICKHKQTNE